MGETSACPAMRRADLSTARISWTHELPSLSFSMALQNRELAHSLTRAVDEQRESLGNADDGNIPVAAAFALRKPRPLGTFLWPSHSHFGNHGRRTAADAGLPGSEETTVDNKVLFVDDEAPVLDGYQRLLRRDFTVNTALGGEQGLALIRTTGPYAVVVSDMRMPGMNGAEFLAHVREKTPNTARILLTGHADLDAAIDAVNRGNIFRFLTTPCRKEVLVEAINVGLAQHHAAVAEKELIEKARLISRSKVEWDSADLCQGDKFEGPAGLPGPSQARSELKARFGNDAQCFVVLVKLTLLPTVEERYGEIAAAEYLLAAYQFLSDVLKTNDRIFHWSRDVLMMVLHRQISPSAVRMELARFLAESPQHLIEVDNRKIMMAISLTFDLLPIAQFSSFDEMLAAFSTKLVGQL